MTTDAPKPPKPKVFTHATYIEDRWPQWKYHSNIGQAKNAATYMPRECWIYEVDETADGGLRELWHITRDMHSSHNEKMPWKNTEKELEKTRQEEIARLKRQISSHIKAAEKLVEKLRELENGRTD